MAQRIVILLGHPDPAATWCRALADAYAVGAVEAGREVRRIDISTLDFGFLRSGAEFRSGAPPAAVAAAQTDIEWAEHLVFVYPLWLGTMPAMLKAFLEQCMRPGFAFSYEDGHRWPKKRLRRRSARVVVTMGMPAPLYRFFYGAHGLKSFERNILHFVGIRPVRETLIGGVEAMSDAGRQRWIARLAALGRRGI
jgi:putative NADPH-quinone reductase